MEAGLMVVVSGNRRPNTGPLLAAVCGCWLTLYVKRLLKLVATASGVLLMPSHL